MKFARNIANTAVDVRAESPEGCFTTDVSAQFLQVPDHVENGWAFVEGVWVAPVLPESPKAQVATPPKVSPVEFKLLFTSPERVAIKAARTTDPVVDDFFEIVEDPRLTYVDLGLESTQQALLYLESVSLITEQRRLQILTGELR